MSIQEVKEKSRIPEYQSTKKTGHADGFQESLIQNLKYQDQGREDIRIKEGGEKKAGKQEGVNRIGNMSGVRVSPAILTEALRTAEVRHMSYEESDNIEIAVTKGYTLKGKRQQMPEGAQVYVEAKYEDGRLEAYQVDIAKVPEQTEHMIEKFALETMQSKEA